LKGHVTLKTGVMTDEKEVLNMNTLHFEYFNLKKYNRTYILNFY